MNYIDIIKKIVMIIMNKNYIIHFYEYNFGKDTIL